MSVEKPDGNLLLAPELSDPESVHAVDDPHSRPVHYDRRQRSSDGRKRPYMLWIFTGKARRIRDGETAHLDVDYQLLFQFFINWIGP
jgi:hypothetical protein